MSLLFAPKRGLIIHWLKQQYNRKHLHKNTILSQFYALLQSHEDLTHPHNIDTLSVIGGKPTKFSLQQLKKPCISTRLKLMGTNQQRYFICQKITKKMTHYDTQF